MTHLPSTPVENSRRLCEHLSPVLAAHAGGPVFLVDGDRTLTAADTSRPFLEDGGVDPGLLKVRFQRDGYCFDAFRACAALHLGVGARFADLAQAVAARVALYPGAAAFLAAAHARAPVYVVTAGVAPLWRAVLDGHGLAAIPVLGGIDPALPVVFGREEKGLVSRGLRERGCQVIALGDSGVDLDMLRAAHHAVVVVSSSNRDLLPQLRGHPSLFQVAPGAERHPGIAELGFSQVLELLDGPAGSANKEREHAP